MLSSLPRLYLDHVAGLSRAYAALCQKLGLDAVLLHSGVARPRSTFDDQFWPLRVVPHFAHFLPLVEADAVLEIRPGRRPVLHRLVEDNFWEKPAPPPAHALMAVDVVESKGHEAMKSALPGPSTRVAFIGEDEAAAARLGHALSTNAPILAAINETRVHKSAYDLACLAEANRVAALGHVAVRDAFLDGSARSELDLHLIYLQTTAQDDADTPYKNIVALGEHGATLHHVSYGRERGPGATSLLLDAGASVLGYASDITRTYVRGRSAEVDAFAQLVAGVDTLQRSLCDEVRVGASYEALHDRAHEHVARVLAEAGVLRGSVDEGVQRGITRAFLPHGLGHSLGITCHDVGCALKKPRIDNPFLRNTRDIEVDQVFTIEPGIYFIPGMLAPLRVDDRAPLVDWKLVDALAPLGGIRIEDDLHVNASGVDNLTRTYL
ncbi:MAG: Xaa-Pro dipeptidase [Polyangia bacterium]